MAHLKLFFALDVNIALQALHMYVPCC